MRLKGILKRSIWFGIRAVRGTRYIHLFDEINTGHPKRILEIGTWNGENAIQMIKAAAKHRQINEIEYYGFDLFEDLTDEVFLNEVSKRPPSLDRVRNMLGKTGVKVSLYKGDTNKVLPEQLPSLPPMDMIFIDGGHSVDTIQNDWSHISQYMTEQTVVIFDDYWNNKEQSGCKPVLDKIDKNCFLVEVLPTIDNFINPDFGRLSIQLAKVTRLKDSKVA